MFCPITHIKKSKLRHVVLSDLVERWKKPDAPKRGRRAGNPTTEEEPTCPVGQRGRALPILPGASDHVTGGMAGSRALFICAVAHAGCRPGI